MLAAAKPPFPDLGLLERNEAVLNFCTHYDNNEPGGKKRLTQNFEIFISWKSLDELASSIRYFAKHPREAEAIREAGHRRALASRQWTHRFQALFQVLSIPQKLSRTRSGNVAAAGQ